MKPLRSFPIQSFKLIPDDEYSVTWPLGLTFIKTGPTLRAKALRADGTQAGHRENATITLIRPTVLALQAHMLALCPLKQQALEAGNLSLEWLRQTDEDLYRSLPDEQREEFLSDWHSWPMRERPRQNRGIAFEIAVNAVHACLDKVQPYSREMVERTARGKLKRPKKSS